MAAHWFYVKDGQQFGPVSLDELQQLIHRGNLASSDEVWSEGMDRWVPISSVAEIRFPAPPPAAQKPTSSATGPLQTQRGRPYVNRQQLSSTSIWTLLHILGAAVLIVACFVPWWKMSVYKPDRSQPALRRLEIDARVGRARERKWYDKHVGPSNMSALETAKPRSRTTLWLWGWGTGTGIAGLLSGIVVLASVVAHMRVVVLRRWAWISTFAWAFVGLFEILFFFAWLAAPSEDVEPILKQGISLGPPLALLGGLALTVAGIVGGIQGLRDFVASSPWNVS